MDKRLLKRHKRQVARAKERVKLSEPDLRTPEQITAAKEASRAPDGRSKGASLPHSVPSVRNRVTPLTGGAAKTDA